MKRRTRLVFWASGVSFALLSAAAGAGWLLPLDLSASRAAQSLASERLDRLGSLFSTLGSLEVSTALFALLVLALLLRGNWRLAVRLSVAYLVVALVEVSMKLYLPVPPISEAVVARRLDFAPVLDAGFPYPYPSGHALRTTMLLGAVCLLQRNRLVWAVSAALLLAMYPSRVYLGVHWTSDVVGGALLGLAGLAWAFGKSFSRSVDQSVSLTAPATAARKPTTKGPKY